MSPIRVLADLWRGLAFAVWKWPLRVLTGRPLPDYALIARMEAELGWGESSRRLTFVSPLAGIGMLNIEGRVSQAQLDEVRERFLAAQKGVPRLLLLGLPPELRYSDDG